MSPPSVRPPGEIIALYERLAAVLATSADLAERQTLEVEQPADRAPPEQTPARRGQLAAERARRTARRLQVREQARRLFSHPPRWRLVFAGSDTPGARGLHDFDAAVIATDLHGTVKVWNAAAERLYGWAAAEVIDRPITAITVGPDDAEVAERIMDAVRSRGAWEGEFWVTRQDGNRFLAYVRDVVVADDDGRPLGLVGLSIDLAPGRSDRAAGTPAMA